MDRLFFGSGAVSGFLGVALGAFAAHGLQGRLDAHDLEIFQVGVRYQMYHALALLAVAFAVSRWSSSVFAVAGWCFIGGTVVFSGSLYALGLSGVRWLGAITPLGGLAFLAGWLCLAWGAFTHGH
jgi:uncharacterized membrane protein YgdD (TMEM256/DUF423 family)